MRRITRFEVSAFHNDVYLENGEVRITNPEIKVCLACDVGDLENKTEEIILHQKYKRCISNAEICACMQEQCGFLEIKKWEKREKKWREIANKFKELI